MKSRIIIRTMLETTLLTVVLFSGACASKDEKSALPPKQGGAPAVQLEKAKAETKAAAESMRDYAYAEKAEFVDQMKKDLVSTQEELDRLGAKVDRASEAARADAKVKLAALRDKWTQAKKQLDLAETATASDWDNVKNGFKQSNTDLKDSFNQIRQWLSDKIAPR